MLGSERHWPPGFAVGRTSQALTADRERVALSGASRAHVAPRPSSALSVRPAVVTSPGVRRQGV